MTTRFHKSYAAWWYIHNCFVNMTTKDTYFMIYNEWKRRIPEGEWLLRMEILSMRRKVFKIF